MPLIQICHALKDLNMSNFDVRNATESNGWLGYCSSLTNLVSPQKISNNIVINNTNLTEDSLLSVLNNLNTVTNKTLTLGDENLAKLSEEQKAIATGKGWTLA
jgi:hypothetical protein